MRTICRRLSAACLMSLLGCGLPFLVTSASVAAQSKPKNATAQCKDGSYSTAKTERGACSNHGGVATWFGAPSNAETKTATTGKTSPPNATATKEATKATAKAGGTPPPPDATGQCKDGTYTKAKSKRGACGGHGGIGTWLAAETTSNGASAASAAPAPAPAPAPRAPSAAPPAPTPAPSAPSAAAKTPSSAPKASPTVNTPENATAKCKDGTFSFAKQHSGACSRHGGVAEWYK